MRQQPGAGALLRKLHRLEAFADAHRDAVDEAERPGHEAPARGEELAVVGLPGHEMVGHDPQRLLTRIVEHLTAEARIDDGILAHVLEAIEAQHVVEIRAHSSLEPRRGQQSIDFPREPCVARERSSLCRREQLRIGRRVPEEVGQARGQAVIVESQDLRIARIRARPFDTEEELRRDEQTREHDSQARVEIPRLARRRVREGDATRDLLVRERPPEESQSVSAHEGARTF